MEKREKKKRRVEGKKLPQGSSSLNSREDVTHLIVLVVHFW